MTQTQSRVEASVTQWLTSPPPQLEHWANTIQILKANREEKFDKVAKSIHLGSDENSQLFKKIC